MVKVGIMASETTNKELERIRKSGIYNQADLPVHVKEPGKFKKR